MSRRNNKILFASLAFVLLAKAGFVFGATSASQSLSKGISLAFEWALGISVILSACVIAFGGIIYMFGGGIGRIIDPKKGTRAPAEAKEWIKAGITGLLIVF